MSKFGDDELPEFSEEWASRGVSEASLRRHSAPPPAPAKPRRGNVMDTPAGPRDWSPAGGDPIGSGPGLTHGRRRRWPWFVAAAVLAGAFVWSSLRTPDDHPAHAPISAAAAPALPSPSDTDPDVLGLSPGLKVGSCFDVPNPASRSSVHFVSCSTAHTFEFIALEAATGSDSAYPPDTYWDGPVNTRCNADLVTYAGQPASKWGPHLGSTRFVPTPSGWANGDRTVYCVAKWQPAQIGSAQHLKPYVPPHGPISSASTR